MAEIVWRVGTKVPLHIYKQYGPEPSTEPWPDGDPPIATFSNQHDAELAVRAVNAYPGLLRRVHELETELATSREQAAYHRRSGEL